VGSTGSRFKLDVSGAPGTLYAFNSPFTPVGALDSDLSLSYGQCLSGSIFLGTVVAVLAPGTLQVAEATGFPAIVCTNCTFVEVTATGGYASVFGNCTVKIEGSTWGRVKALYR